MYRGTRIVEEYRSTVVVQGYNEYRRTTGKVQGQSGTRVQQ
jgi:hypothetical protein